MKSLFRTIIETPRAACLGWVLSILGMTHSLPCVAQPLDDLSGKKLAVYFTRKHFDFDEHYRIPLSQFVMADKGKEISIEDLKSQTLISLGSLFSSQLQSVIGADTVYFMNAQPSMAKAFMASYNLDSHQMAPMTQLVPTADFVLVINPMVLGSYKTSTVYSRSNRLVTEQLNVKTARLKLELFNPKTGRLEREATICMDDRHTQVPEIMFAFHMENSQTGKFLGKLFSLAWTHLNLGVTNNCEGP